MGSYGLEYHTDLQYRGVPDNDRCLVGFFLAGGDVYILARTGKESALLMALAADWVADRVWISLQIYERVRARFGFRGARIGSPAKTGICATRFIFPARYVRSLHRPADYLERAACLDHAHASAITRGHRAGVWLHPAEILSFLGQHFLAYSPFLFLALAWGVIGSWRRVNQQFKVLFLMWFGFQVFLFYLLLSINKSAEPNWDGLAFLGFGLLAVYFWWERLEASVMLRLCASVALLGGLVMSVIALDTDLLRTAGYPLWRRDPSDRMRGWKSATGAVEKMRNDLEAQLGEKLFLIADARDRASEISFYLRDKRLEGSGHPPVYITESQDMVNQFSFWPRYDEFVERKPGAPQPEGEVYTEENGINPFAGRDALFIREGEREHVPHNIRAAFQSTEPVGTIEVRRYGKVLRTWQVFLCRNYRTLPL